MTEGLRIYYDGDCPFCSAYMRMLNLRDAVGTVDLIDARSDDPRLRGIGTAGFDLDEGIVVDHGGRLLHGAEAMQLLSVLSRKGGILRAIMRSPRRAALVYPVLKAGRRLSLMALRRGRLR